MILTAIVLSAGGSGPYTCTEIERKQTAILVYIRRQIHRTIQKHRAHKIEGKTHKRRKKHKTNNKIHKHKNKT